MPKRLTPRGDAAPPVEPIVTGATLPPRESVEKKTRRPKGKATHYVRNLHHIQARVKLNSGRDIELQPRGQREDLDIVTTEEMSDPKFLANKDLIFEIIDADTAAEIIAKQQTNASKRKSSLWDHLRTADGKAYEQTSATIEEAFERQGIVVGRIEQTGAGRFTDKNFEVKGVDVRTAGPQYTEVPGSPNHPATKLVDSVPSEISPEDYHEFLLWKQFKEQQARSASE